MFRLTEDARLEVEIKNSHFIAVCTAVSDDDDIRTAIARLNATDATHNCWAWRLGERYRFNDDGEPGGSAGRPMLAAIDGQKFDGVLAHVVRYFGGTKLGVGGLVRAYGGTVAECLRTAQKAEIIPFNTMKFRVGFAETHPVYGLIAARGIIKNSEEFTDQGVIFNISAPQADCDDIRTALQNATRARILWLDE